jgi:hypothetical protein
LLYVPRMILGIIARRCRRQAGLAVGAIALTSISGCSLVFVEGPPHDHASRHFFDCTTSMLAPGLDAALTGATALAVLGVASDQTHTTGDIVTQSALVVGAMASATYGYLQVSKCRQAKDDLGERLINMPYLGVPPQAASRAPLPAPGAPPPPPAAGSPATAPAPRDPWLSEGPPPSLSEGRREPVLMPPPPPYLRVAPHTTPLAAPPPDAAVSPAGPPPPPPDARVEPPAAPPPPVPPPPPAHVADPESP